MNIPQSLTAGDTWSWTDSLGDYPASTWTLTYYFSGPAKFSVAASADGDDHAVSVDAATTGGYKHGSYEWIARVTDGSTVKTIASGELEVEPNLANEAIDHRSFNQRAFEALQAVIEGRATNDHLSFTIAGQSLSRMSWDDLLKAYDRFKIAAANDAGGGADRVFIRFGRP